MQCSSSDRPRRSTVIAWLAVTAFVLLRDHPAAWVYFGTLAFGGSSAVRLLGQDAAGRALLPLVERLPREQIHHEKDAAIIVDPIVEHRHGGGVPHFVGDVPLAREALSDLVVRGELGVEQLDGDGASVVAMP